MKTQGASGGPAVMSQVRDDVDGCRGLVRSGWLPATL